MQRRGCSNIHFINTIKGSSVTKVHNMNSLSKPALLFKKLRDVYEGLTSCTNRMDSASQFSNIKVKIENQDLPMAEHDLHEVETPTNEALPCGSDGDLGRDLDDSTFGEMTLKQLKKSCKTKKRKLVNVQSFNPPLDQIKVEPVEDDPDLEEPLISLKAKVPKAKKKCRDSSTPSVLTRCKSQDLKSPRQLRLQTDSLLPVQFKVDAMEFESEGRQNVIYAGYSDTVNQKGELGVAEVMPPFMVDDQSLESNLCDKDFQSCILNGVSSDQQENADPLTSLIPRCEEIMDVEDQENLCRQFVLLPTSDYGKELQSTSPIEDKSAGSNGSSLRCDLDEFSGHSTSNSAAVTPEKIAYDSSGEETYHDGVSSDHQENVEPLAVLSPIREEIMDVKDQENLCPHFVLLPTLEYGKELQSTSPIDDKSAGSNGSSLGCDLDEFSGHSTSNSAALTPQRIACDSSGEETYHAGDSLLQCPSNTRAQLVLSEADRCEERQSLERATIDRVNNSLSNIETHTDLAEDGLSTGEEGQPPSAANVDAENAERDSISCSQNFAVGESSLSSVAVQVPERLLSTRKVVSPTSEERLCLSMNSARPCGDADFLDCNEVISNEEQTEVQSLSEESEMHENVSKSTQEPSAVRRIKFIISPSQIRKKTKHGRFSPPKGNIEGPRNTRSLPRVNAGCTSVQGCSQNAIAFSQRQMQDIESLSMKLMSELKSMKDIVEEKLLFEAYRSLSSKSDADEVKNAITNATKTEEMAKKWLSIMGRDCNRFCKIMSQNSNVTVDSNETPPREKRKITFADEAGGDLCHVKFFENGMTSQETKE